MLKREVIEIVKNLIPTILDGCLVDVIQDTGGLGFCEECSTELVSLIGGRTVWLNLDKGEVFIFGEWCNHGINERYSLVPIDPLYHFHCVALIGDWVVDLTARQYNEKLPFPFIWKFNK